LFETKEQELLSKWGVSGNAASATSVTGSRPSSTVTTSTATTTTATVRKYVGAASSVRPLGLPTVEDPYFHQPMPWDGCMPASCHPPQRARSARNFTSLSRPLLIG
jgi:hypothetical protein